MGELQEEHEPIDRAIVRELISIIPEGWHAAVLEIGRTVDPRNIVRYSHEVFSPDGHKDVVQPTEELFQRAIELDDVFAAHGCAWRGVKYLVSEEKDGGWKYTIDYRY